METLGMEIVKTSSAADGNFQKWAAVVAPSGGTEIHSHVQ